MKVFLIYLIALYCILIEAFTTIHPIKYVTKIHQKSKNSFQLFATEESDDEIRERIRAKAKKNLYNENGIAFAPWVSNQLDLDAIVEDAFRKEKEKKVQKKPASILDRGEVETSEGMRWRMNGELVELGWGTGVEADNQGFIVEKRPSYGGDFQEIASFKEVSSLVSRGKAGGRYRYTDPSTGTGSWIYRIQDCDSNGNKNMLCQCFVEVQSSSDSKFQSVSSLYHHLYKHKIYNIHIFYLACSRCININLCSRIWCRICFRSSTIKLIFTIFNIRPDQIY